MAEIVLDHVTKRFPDGALAVDDVNLTIADGEFVILVGPSGCGKSTTLNMIAGLEDISDGELRIDGQVANQKSPRDRDIGMVFQNYALYPHMTVRENMAFSLKLSKTDKATVDERVNWAAEILDLTDHLDRKPGQLSGGQRQRVAMGRVIVRTPNAFLMDEPLSNLDAKLRVQMRTEVSRLQKRLKTTTVYVTHDQVEAMTLGDRVAVMRGGVIQQVGPPEELYDRPANLFVAGFIGSPAMNFLPATVEGDVLRSPLGDLRLPAERRRRLGSDGGGGGRSVIIGIRPEHLEDAALVGDKRDQGTVFKANVDLLESLGSDKYAYFTVQSERASARHLEELAEDAGGVEMATEDGVQVTARLDSASKAKEDQELEFWLDLRRVHVFDPESGENLTVDTHEGGDEVDRQADGASAAPAQPADSVAAPVAGAPAEPADEPAAAAPAEPADEPAAAGPAEPADEPAAPSREAER
ncbi:MAG TPA: sn-glycerol-3-phosphate ABC transporter ATP-binding protein UgpC [Gaiellales bacterium]|jgi:multiple sugar transport system ATP-binding protein|nr:sn-glycerol-3-phosphate ABC transporter ATP-binding protein UgpC [Gaiellales bacterium]